MKKILFGVLALVILSCSSSDDAPPPAPTFDVSKLLRGWAYNEVVSDGIFLPYDHNPDCYMDYFGFRDTQTQPRQFEEGIFTGAECSVATTILEWEAVGNHVDLFYGGNFVARIIIIELTDDYFHGILEADFDHDIDVDRQEFTGVPYDPFDSF